MVDVGRWYIAGLNASAMITQPSIYIRTTGWSICQIDNFIISLKMDTLPKTPKPQMLRADDSVELS